MTTNYVINEVSALLPSRTRITQAQMVAYVDSLLASQHITVIHIDPQLHADAWALIKTRIDKEWSLVDAASFVVMRQRTMTEALTIDHDFAQAGFVLLPAQP